MSEVIAVRRDVEGYLVDPEDWNETLAEQLAGEEGLSLGAAYWPIIHFMREYWQEHQVAPDVRHVVAFMADSRDMDKKMAKDELFGLFPYGYVKQACKVAGMMRPRGWSTG
ncbi:MAG: TusE/DsrC/DsvC family sulfur relay protein [Betaproteobacteria bacterium]|nr:TusE/DsrC/DsvC family sulfur relay protein [Betaproteobacteria bacterium]